MTERVFHVLLTRTGPQWKVGRPVEEQARWAEHAVYMDGLVSAGYLLLGGPLSDETRVVLAIRAASAEYVRRLLHRDPWGTSHLVIRDLDEWTIRLGGDICHDR